VRQPPFGLRWRIAAIFALTLTITDVSSIYVLYRIEKHNVQQQFEDAASAGATRDALLLTRVATTQTTTAKAVVAVRAALTNEAQGGGPNSFGIADISTQLKLCHGSIACPAAPAPFPEQLNLIIPDFTGPFTEVWADDAFNNLHYYLTLRPLEPFGHRNQRLSSIEVVESYSFTTQLDQLARLRTTLLEISAAGLVLAVLVGLAIATGIRRPIRRVTEAANQFARGNLDIRTPTRGRSELADLARSFNSMADHMSTTLRQLRQARTLQRRFVADVSHELRTPLSAMLAAGDNLDSSDVQVRDRVTVLLRSQTRRLVSMVENLLEVSRFDVGQAKLDLEPADLLELARDAAHTVAPDTDIRLTGLGNVQADVDVRRIHTIVRNLIANAVQHGAPPIEVTIDGRADPLLLTVTDHGAGIPNELRATIFDRFVRGENARTTTTDNTGLGLAIAYENAALHRATLIVAERGPTAFILQLPRQQPDASN